MSSASRLLFPLLRGLERRARVLRYLFLEITQRCNLRCLHCGSDCTAAPREGELSTAEWLAVVDQVARDFNRRELLVVLTGGEPLCAPGYGAILARLHERRLHFGMVSNGWALDPGRLAEARAAGLSSLTVSVDGLEESHDRLRGRPGSYQHALAAVRAAAAAGLSFFDVVTCVHPGNLGELDALRSTLGAAGAPAWRLFTIFPRGRARDDASLLLDPAQLQRLLGWIAACRRHANEEAGQGGALRPSYSCEGYLPAAWDHAVRDQDFFCRAGINIASVLCDGRISGCPSLPRTLSQGDVRRERLADVWAERFRPFTDRRWMQQGACAGCGDFSRCQGSSLHLWDDGRAGPTRCHVRDLGSPAPPTAGGRMTDDS